MNTSGIGEIEAVEEDESQQYFLKYSFGAFMEGRRASATTVGQAIERECYGDHHHHNSQHYITVSKKIRLVAD